MGGFEQSRTCVPARLSWAIGSRPLKTLTGVRALPAAAPARRRVWRWTGWRRRWTFQPHPRRRARQATFGGTGGWSLSAAPRAGCPLGTGSVSHPHRRPRHPHVDCRCRWPRHLHSIDGSAQRTHTLSTQPQRTTGRVERSAWPPVQLVPARACAQWLWMIRRAFEPSAASASQRTPKHTWQHGGMPSSTPHAPRPRTQENPRDALVVEGGERVGVCMRT